MVRVWYLTVGHLSAQGLVLRLVTRSTAPSPAHLQSSLIPSDASYLTLSEWPCVHGGERRWPGFYINLWGRTLSSCRSSISEHPQSSAVGIRMGSVDWWNCHRLNNSSRIDSIPRPPTEHVTLFTSPVAGRSGTARLRQRAIALPENGLSVGPFKAASSLRAERAWYMHNLWPPFPLCMLTVS